MKKKVLLITLIVAMLAIAVSGTLAYFTAEDSVNNTFTIGSVKIEVYENGEATDEDTISFGKLTPIVNVDDPSKDVSYMKKEVNVKNIGNNSAYIRVHIAVPAKLVYTYLCLDLNTEGWVARPISEAVVDNVTYQVFTYDYMSAVAPEKATADLLKGVYLASDVDLLENEDGDLEFIRRIDDYVEKSEFIAHTKNENGGYTSSKVSVLVASQAIQADGFENYEAALKNFTTHPWPKN